MHYFKKAELAETYHVSEKTITNWIREAKDGKLDLALYEDNGRAWVVNTTKNIALMEQLVEGRRKFRNSRGIRTIAPKSEFYKLYSEEQMFDIASSLEIYHEIPFQYDYFDGGAEYWDSYADRLAFEEVPNFLNSTVKQLRVNQGYIDELLQRYKRINIVDIGAGNAMPVKELLQHLLDAGKLGRYIDIDISAPMIRIARRNITEWFGDRVTFEGYEADVNYDRFVKILADDAIGEHAKDTVNMVLAFGGTFSNLRSPDRAFKIIHDSMNRNDLFIYCLKLDSEATRQYFDFAVGEITPLDSQTKMIVDLLNIDESFYDVEMGFDPVRRQRYIRIRLKIALNITFEFEKGTRTVELNKNDAILLWRYWHQNADEVVHQLKRNDFQTFQISQTEDRDYLLTVSRVKSE